MSETRRRRVGSESDHNLAPAAESVLYDKHEGKLKNYSSPTNYYNNSCQQQQQQQQQPFDLSLMAPPLKDLSTQISSARDRTMEFAKLIQTLQSRNIKRVVHLRELSGRNPVQTQRHAEFMMIARTIGRNVSATYAKLQKLTLLASNKSLIKDQPIEIQELTYMIREDINSLNRQIAKLQEVAKMQKENKKHLASHTSNVVLGLQTKLANMTTEFKQVLEVRTENLKHQKSRRDQYVSEPTMSNSKYSSLLAAEEVSIEMDHQARGDNASVPLLQSQSLVTSYDQTDDYLQSRADAMQNIESTIVELGGIFQQLAHLVKEQEEMVDRIDSNVDSVGLNVEAAHNELVKYFRSVSSNRKLMIKVFGILIAFFLFFVIFLT